MNSEEEFYDAVTGFESDDSETRLESFSSKSGSSTSEQNVRNQGLTQENGIKKYRNALPAPMYSRNQLSLWSILKKCIGLELSKITMPIIFNEPLSFLQRITEYMEHTYLIHKASLLSDSVERMQTVAAFAVSAVASQWERTGKPFNPLLGETYELRRYLQIGHFIHPLIPNFPETPDTNIIDMFLCMNPLRKGLISFICDKLVALRDDLGFRLVSEQVSHHPPVSAFYSEGINKDFVFHGSIYPKLKFWGKSVEAEPRGTITLELKKHNEAYSWTNPSCCVHNVIIGKLWIEQYGTVEIMNHSTGEKCLLHFKPCGLFGKELHRVEGYIQDKSKRKVCVIYGKWTECLWCVDTNTYETYKKNDKKSGDQKKAKETEDVVRSENDEADDMPEIQETVQVIPGSKLLWRIAARPSHSTQMYNFTNFAMMLNELDEEMQSVLAPTDCRFRPDIRAMENGNMDFAGSEKERLEEKQRAARKERAKKEEEWRTRWFRQDINQHTRTLDWIYTGKYWERNYEDCPDIY